MKNLALVLMLVVAGSALMISTGGCGSGGSTLVSGDASTPNAKFFGGYFWQLWSGQDAGPMNTSQWGIVTADGAGMMPTGLVASNVGGVLTPPSPTPALPYLADENGGLEITVGGGTLAGGIAEDGAIAAVTQVTPGLDPALAILARGEGVFNNASLTGEYHLCGFWFNGASGNDFAHWGGTVTFDGVGGAFNYSAGINNQGLITPPQPPMGWGAYNVGPNGVVTWNHPLAHMSGGIALGGDLVVLSGTTQADNIQRLAILIRKGAGLNDATLSGDYHITYLASGNAPPPRYFTYIGRAQADGAGMMGVGPGTSNADGNVQPEPVGAGLPYAVSPDGTLSVVGSNLLGGVSPDGRVAVFAGGTMGGVPQLWFMFR